MHNNINDKIKTTLAVAIEPTYFDLEREYLDVKGIVQLLKAAHVNTLRVGMYSHQGHVYYQSKIAVKAPGLGDRDLLREFVNACEEVEMRLAVYADSKFDDGIFLQHPDWVIIHNGKPAISDMGRLHITPLCPNSPFLEFYKDVLKEIVAYGPDFIYVDNFGLSPNCECPYCLEKFKSEYGAEWVDGLWQKRLKWVRRMNQELAKGIVKAVKDLKKEIGVVFNMGHFWGMTPEEIYTFAHEIADNVHAESSVRWYGQPFRHIDEQCAFGRAIDTPLWTWVEYPMMPWSHLSCPPSEIKIKAAKVLANSGRPMLWSFPRAPDCDERGLEGVQAIYGLVEAFPQYFNDSTHISFAGILCSTQTRQQYAEPTQGVFERYRSEFHGFFLSLLRNHIPFDILLDKHINVDELSKYKVLFLPNAACLSDAQCEAIRNYVRVGGGLFATYETSLYTETSKRRADFGLKDIFGCSYMNPLGAQSIQKRTAGYMSIEREHPLCLSFANQFKFPIGGNYLGVEPQEVAFSLGSLIQPSRYYCDHFGKSLRFTGLIANLYGAGKVVYVPGELGATYEQEGFAEHKRLIKNAIEWLTSNQLPLRTSLPSTVELTMAKNTHGDLILHIVNTTTDLSCPVEEVAAMIGHTLEVRLPSDKSIKRIFSLCSKGDLCYTLESGYVAIKLPIIFEYEVVVVELE